jgi:serine/threonine protein kinase
LISKRGSVAIADFGIAAVAELEASSRTEASLSPPFAPPERFVGGEVDERKADLYGLGATIFFACSGRPPFGTSADGGISGLAERVRHSPLVSPPAPRCPRRSSTCSRN